MARKGGSAKQKGKQWRLKHAVKENGDVQPMPNVAVAEEVGNSSLETQAKLIGGQRVPPEKPDKKMRSRGLLCASCAAPT